jgi:pimeloyl-ACP methyl ester carboxylesterase
MNLQQKLALTYLRLKIRLLRLFSTKLAAAEAFKIFCTPFSSSVRKPKEAFSAADQIEFDWNGLHIYGYDVNRTAEKKLLLLHGFSSNCNNFEKYVAPAVAKGYRVFAFDAPAHGRSSGRQTNALEYAGFITELHKRYGPFNAFISHSFGGLALCLAMEELPHDEKTKMVLIAPATETSSAIDGAFRTLKIHDQEIRREFESLIFRISGKKANWFSVGRAMHRIRAEVLWIHDEDDDITPAADAHVVEADAHPNIRFIFTRNLGHRKIYRDTEQMANVIGFI